MSAGHGVNIGHGYVKYSIVDEHGVEREPAIFPALIARADRQIQGALERVPAIAAGGGHWWVGQDALLSAQPLTLLAQQRLSDPAFIPALLKGAFQRLGELNGASSGFCVTGLPASWASDVEKAKLLGARLREATPHYSGIRVIPEPLGLIYATLLDTDGQVAGDPSMQRGTVGVVDLGHHTVDIAVIRQLKAVPSSLDTFELGTARPLKEIRSRLSALFERDLTLYETDQAVRAGALRVAGVERPLPPGWDRPLLQNGELIGSRLVEAWGKGAQLDAILIGGGGAELEPLTAGLRRHFAHAQVVPNGQLAIARGYARFARRLAREQS